MTLIEGVGDEVTQFFVLLLIVAVGITAWWSTSITDQPLIRTVLILERRTRRVAVEPPPSPATSRSSVENSIDTGQDQAAGSFESQQDVVVEPVCQICDKEETPSASTSQNINNDEAAEADSSTNNVREISASVEDNRSMLSASDLLSSENNIQVGMLTCDVSSQPSETSLLRNRRLAFFQSRNMTLVEPSLNDEPMPSTTNSVELDDELQSTSQPNATQADELAGGEQPSAGSIRIRLKYLNDDQKLVEGRLQEQLGDFKRRHFGLELAADKFVRLIFKGQVLQSDNETLEGYGLFDNCVVHCLVHQQRSQSEGQVPSGSTSGRTQTTPEQGTASPAPHRDWDLGNILFALLSIILGLAWYCRFQYAQLFNITSTIALVGLTGILTVSLIGIYLPDQDGIRNSLGH